MEIPITDKNDIKIFLLYLMDCLGYPLDYSTVSEIVILDGVVNYFDFAECFNELLDAGHILKKPEKDKKGDDVFFVSETGKIVARELQDRIARFIRDEGLKSALRYLSFEKRGAEVEANYEPDEHETGKYMVHFIITEKKKELLNVTLRAESDHQAQKMVFNFKKRPEAIYRGMVSLLSGEVDYLLRD